MTITLAPDSLIPIVWLAAGVAIVLVPRLLNQGLLTLSAQVAPTAIFLQDKAP